MGKPVDRPGSPPLPEGHEQTRYAQARVCRRCGQDWPCTFALGIPIRERAAPERDDELPPGTIRLAWSRTGLTVTPGRRW